MELCLEVAISSAHVSIHIHVDDGLCNPMWTQLFFLKSVHLNLIFTRPVPSRIALEAGVLPRVVTRVCAMGGATIPSPAKVEMFQVEE